MGLRCEIEGKQYEYNSKLTVADAMFIYDKAQVGVADLNRALLVEANPYVIAAWVYLMKRRADEVVRWEDMLKLDVSTFKFVTDETDEPVDGEPQAVVEPQKENPTSPSGRSRKGAIAST